MKEVRILILFGNICKVYVLGLSCLLVELFELGNSRFRWQQGGLKLSCLVKYKIRQIVHLFLATKFKKHTVHV